MKLNHLIITAIFLILSSGVSHAERIEYSNGDVYEGEVRNGKAHGLGKVTYARGDIYEGDFSDDKKNGFGRYTFGLKAVNAGDIHEGEYKDLSLIHI